MNLRLLLALLVPLCAFAGEERIAYTCDNGSQVDISFSADSSGRPLATLHFADAAVVLPKVPSAAGVLYRSGDIRLATKDNEAIFEDGKHNRRRCSRGAAASPQPQAAAQPAVSSFIDISGSVTYRTRVALPPNAILSIRVHAGKQTLVEQSYELNGAQVPIPFSATVDRDLLGKKAGATISARIEAGGKALFVSSKPAPAIKKGRPVPVNIVLKPARRR